MAVRPRPLEVGQPHYLGAVESAVRVIAHFLHTPARLGHPAPRRSVLLQGSIGTGKTYLVYVVK